MNKKTKILVSVTCCCLVLLIVVIVLVVLVPRNNPKQFTLLEVQGFDATNATNLSQWQQVPLASNEILASGNRGGEGGQWPLCITGDAEDGSLMFYGTDVGGLYRSTDGGESWHKSMKDLLAHGVCDVAIDPNNKNRVLCFGSNGRLITHTTGVYYSDDIGASWNFSQHFPVSGTRKVKESLAFDPSSYSEQLGGSAVAYLSLVEKEDAVTPVLTEENRGLYKSTDGGKSWTRINAQLTDAIVKVSAKGKLLVGNYDGLFVSDDGGATFNHALNQAVTGLDVLDDTAYVLTDVTDGANSEAKLWRLNNGAGATLISELTNATVDLTNLEWQKFYVAEGNDTKCYYHFDPAVNKVFSLKVSPVESNHMIMGYCTTAANYSENTMYSTDGGATWHSSVRDNERENFNVKEYNFLPHNTRVMNFYWSRTSATKVWDFENDFISSSDNCGQLFTWDANGVNGLCTGGVFGINIFDSNLIYVGAQDYNGAFSADGGKTWQYVNASGQSFGGHLYGGYPASETVIFGAHAAGWTTDRYLAVSYDGGKTVVRHDNDPAYKLASGYGNRLNNQANFVGYQAFNNRNILFCNDLRSTDMGQTWSRMTGVTGVFAHDATDGTLYGVDDAARNIVFSTDDGATWQVLVGAPDLNPYWDQMYISDLAVDGVNKFVYAAADWSKLYKISIDGRTVEDVTDNVPLGLQKDGMPSGSEIEHYFARRITTVAVDPNHPEIVYVGGASYGYQSDSGLFRSCDGGKTFYALTSNSTTSVVRYGAQGGFEPTCVRVDANGTALVAGGCLGMSKIAPPYETDATRAVPTHKLTLELGYETDFGGYLVHDGRVAAFADPTREGYVFEGWFVDNKYTVRYDLSPVTADVTLYAKWRRE